VIISGSNVLVTGGASGIGAMFVAHLSALGAQVWVVDRDARALRRLGSSVDLAEDRLITCDVGVEGQVVDAVARIEHSAGIDILVNNAAELHDQALVSKLGKHIKKHSFDEWESTLRSNLSGTFLMGREVSAAMINAKRKGLIVNMSSVVHVGNPGQSAYSATKGGIEALTVTWSQELAPYGIRVAAVAPGFVQTALTKGIPPLFLQKLLDRSPLNRYGRLEEIAHALVFVIESDYFHGKTLELDGGMRF
jgi:3-oxoacyl-[acyl-carrier protein] reductase